MTTITLTKEQTYNLCNGLSITIEPHTKPQIEKWEPKHGDYYIAVRGDILQSVVLDQKIADFGLYYPTKEDAEKARDAMRIYHRLLAWLAENDDGWVANWGDQDQSKHFVRFNARAGEYTYKWSWSYQIVGVVYMSLENAKKLCNLLNEGVVEL